MKSINYPSFYKRLQLNIHRKFVDSEIKLHDLKYLFWECTLRCNLNCIHCGSDCHKDTSIADMPAKDFLKLTELISNKYNPNKITLVLTGGEPLMRGDIEEIGLGLNRQGYPWGIVSNGMLLSEERFKSLKRSGLSTITISLDGLKDNHNWFRGNELSFEKASEAIKIVANNNEKTAFDVVTCVNKRNIDQLSQIRDFLIGCNVKQWRIFTIFPIGRAKYNELLQLSNEEFLKLMDFIKITRKEQCIKVKYGCEAFLGNYENEVRDGFFFCRAGVNIASVLADGSIGACPNINHTFIQGNIYKDDFINIWENSYRVYRNRKENMPQSCLGCDAGKWCLGSSMHLRDSNNELVKCHYKMLG